MMTNTLDMTKVPGGWKTDEKVDVVRIQYPETRVLSEGVRLVSNFMSIGTVNRINEMMKKAPGMAPVSIQGLKEVTPETTGSWRTTMFNEAMAERLKCLFDTAHFDKERVCDDYTPTDWWQGDKNRRHWKYAGVSPMLRYMRYKTQGRHAVHYDAGYIYPDDNKRTLCSFVLYLSTNSTGATRIINDGQSKIPVWDRNHGDWDVDATPEQVIAKSLPVAGSVLIFDHRIPHDVELYDGAEGDRIIIRGDLIFEAE